MSGWNSERWNAASGYLVILLGIAGAAFERGGPAANAPIEDTLRFVSTYRTELLAQSVMFVLSAGAYLWFFGALRGVLVSAEKGTATISTIAFGAGIISSGMQMILQALQVALALAVRDQVASGIAGLFGSLMWAVSVIAYVPVAVMLAAVALVSLRHRALPCWLAWFSGAASLAHLIMSLGLVAERGPLVPGGALTYALYAILLAWLLAITTVMVFGSTTRPGAVQAGT